MHARAFKCFTNALQINSEMAVIFALMSVQMSLGKCNLSFGTFWKKVNWGRPRVIAAAAQGLNPTSGPSVHVIPRLSHSVSSHSSPAPLK